MSTCIAGRQGVRTGKWRAALFRAIVCLLLLSITNAPRAEEADTSSASEQESGAPDNEARFRQWAQAYGAGDYSLALDIADQLIQLAPDDYRGYWLRSESKVASSEDYEGAIADLEQVNRLAPGNADAWGLRGWYLILQGRFQDARIPTEKAQALDPTSYSWAVNLATLSFCKPTVILQCSGIVRACRSFQTRMCSTVAH